MSCNEQESVSALFDGALSGDEETRTRSHLEQCADCQAFTNEIRELSGVVHRAGVAALDVQVSNPHSASRDTPFWRRRIAVPVPVLTTLLAALLLVAGFLIVPNDVAVENPARDDSVQSTATHTLAEYDAGKPAVVVVRARTTEKETSE